jgi:hypothetical protein
VSGATVKAAGAVSHLRYTQLGVLARPRTLGFVFNVQPLCPAPLKASQELWVEATDAQPPADEGAQPACAHVSRPQLLRAGDARGAAIPHLSSPSTCLRFCSSSSALWCCSATRLRRSLILSCFSSSTGSAVFFFRGVVVEPEAFKLGACGVQPSHPLTHHHQYRPSADRAKAEWVC